MNPELREFLDQLKDIAVWIILIGLICCVARGIQGAGYELIDGFNQ